MSEEISVEELRRMLRYEPDTGRLFWLPRTPGMFSYSGGHTREHSCAKWNAQFAGSEAFTHTMPNGYRQGRVNRRAYLAHRVAWAIHHGSWPKMIDHRDGNRANNRIDNLREATRAENAINSKKQSRPTSSAHRGVCLPTRTGRWVAYLTINGRRVHLGTFESEADAAAARSAAEIAAYGDFSPSSLKTS